MTGLRIHYEESFKCRAGCGVFVNRIGQTCNRCLIRAEQENAEEVKALLREKLDPEHRRFVYDSDGREVA